jgi:hypothetical protein
MLNYHMCSRNNGNTTIIMELLLLAYMNWTSYVKTYILKYRIQKLNFISCFVWV